MDIQNKKVLTLLKKKKIQKLIDLCSNPDVDIRIDAVNALVEIGKEALLYISNIIRTGWIEKTWPRDLSLGDLIRLIDIIENHEEPEPDFKVLSQSLPEEVRIILDTLPKREAIILKLYYGLDGEKPHTLEEIGVKLKVTRERIRQIKERALGRLRHGSRGTILHQYLE